ncbi:hypothetical protein NNJEOMEG_01524 [Fundidesulfovibrio magnetotacticus]|uniref:Uncharacterized protein n=1 Tax=Fundidesulfovibrio magnetotacticus TaxID=2730080 RepID=A0A6V8LRT7_9BACT|nr:hypothetical protein [Fundidesulfovibrio magnetotacticus]GFK93690.1 hypothetical protein NNJEOMEG_01524 [Fundidesulfovibrio magnetotacticus]
MRRITASALALLVALLVAASAMAQGNKQLMSQKMAEQDLKRNIVEAVIGYKVKSQGEFGLTEDAQYQVDTKAAAVIKGIKVDKMIYDRQKDVALCFGHIELGDIINVLGERISFKNVRVEGFGFGTMTEASRPPLRALRAALINAYDEMAAKLVGEKILSQSRAENFILTKDSNRSKVCAAVFGAYIPNPGINAPNRGWGWDETGNAFVFLEMDARKVKDLLGNKLVYKGENIIQVRGIGAQVDEVSGVGPDGKSANLTRDPGSKTQYMDLNMPGSTPPPPQEELKGKPAQ